MDDCRDDWQLLGDYTASSDQEAFGTLVRRHVDMVYSAALRQVRDRDLAEDVTQAVFVALARKARALHPPGPLAAWLLRATHFAARNVLKIESRRRFHEARAAKEIKSVIEPERSSTNDISDLIDRAMIRLAQSDNQVLVLRYFQGLDLEQTAEELGVNRATAAKRASRALARLRRILESKSNASISLAALSGWLAAESVHASPPLLSGAITATVSSTSTPVAINGIAEGVIHMFTLAKLKVMAAFGMAGLILMAATVATIAQVGEQTRTALSPANPGMTISPAQWMEDRNLGTAFDQLIPSLNQMILIPQQTPDDLVEVSAKVITQAQANDASDHNLMLRIDDPTDPEPHIISVYFFRTDRWPGPPALVTSGGANQLLGVTLPAGSYRAVALDGGGGFHMFGLPTNWPQAIDVENSKIARLELRMSPRLTRVVRNSKGGGIADLNRTNMTSRDPSVHGRVTNARGQPIAGALVQVRQDREDGDRGFASPDLQANTNGYFGMPPVTYRYHLGAMLAWPLTELPGFRWRYIGPNEIFEGRREVNITIPDWPKQTGTVSGRVVDSNGRDVDAFTIGIDSSFWPKVGSTDLPIIDNWGIKAGFTNGRFEIKDVPAGPSKLYASVSERSQQFPPTGPRVTAPMRDIAVKPGEILEITIQVAEQQPFMPPSGRAGGRGGRQGT